MTKDEIINDPFSAIESGELNSRNANCYGLSNAEFILLVAQKLNFDKAEENRAATVAASDANSAKLDEVIAAIGAASTENSAQIDNLESVVQSEIDDLEASNDANAAAIQAAIDADYDHAGTKYDALGNPVEVFVHEDGSAIGIAEDGTVTDPLDLTTVTEEPPVV